METLDIKRKPLTKEQEIRLINLFDICEPLTKSEVVEVGVITKFEIEYANHNESIYMKEEDIDFVLNGLNIERD